MAPLFVLLAAAAAALPAAPAPVEASAINPRAGELLEREPSLRSWALRFYDANGDGWLTLGETQAAVDAFRALADSDGDGQVTVSEYRAAVAFIAARY